MKKVYPQADWKESWIYSYPYDLMEIYNERKDLGSKSYGRAYDKRKQAAIRLIQDSLPNRKGKILDVAAAQGNFSLLLAEMGYDVTWNDLREELVDYVKLKHEIGNIEFSPGNVFETGFDEKFDLVLITEIIEHVAHPDEFLSLISTLVKPNGFIVLTTPLGDYFLNKLPRFTEFSNPSIFESVQFKPNSDGHIFLLHHDEFEVLAKKSNLEIEQMTYYSNFVTSGHLKTRFLNAFVPDSWFNSFEKFTQSLSLSLGKKLHTNIAVLLKKNE